MAMTKNSEASGPGEDPSPRDSPTDSAPGNSGRIWSAADPENGVEWENEGKVGKYVYCVVELPSELDLGPIGIGSGVNRVYTVHYHDLAAVVSDTPITLYDPTRENLLAHELVNETLMREHTVIPMSFGTIFRTEDDVVELLRSTGKAFKDVLSKVRGKIELGLKVLWDRDRVVARLEEENPEIAGLRQEIAETTRGSTYFARVQLGRLVESAMEERANDLVTNIYDALRPVSVASRSNRLIGDNMIMNAAFLVDRSREGDFDREVKELSLRHKEQLSFKYTGPWPPYNFVNIKLKLERAGS